MWKKLATEFAELSPTGMAYTLRGVQLKRPTMYELEGGLRTLRVPTLVLWAKRMRPRSSRAASWRARLRTPR